MVDPSLPPGTTHADIDRHYGPPETLRILGSVLVGVDAETHTPATTEDLERALKGEVDREQVFEAEIGDRYTRGDTVHVAGGVWVAAVVEVPGHTSERERERALMESIETPHDVVEARIGEVER